jgi:hypothetical protein
MPAQVKPGSPVQTDRIEKLIDHAKQKFEETMAIKGEPNRLFFPHGITSLEVAVTIEKVAGVTIKVSGPDSAKPGVVSPAAAA